MTIAATSSAVRLPQDQERIRAKCFHPSGIFVPFPDKDTEQSIPKRFEKIVRLHPNRVAVQVQNATLTYEALNKAANKVAHLIVQRLGREKRPIVILSEYTTSAIVYSLAIWKSGNILIALDPSLAQKQFYLRVQAAQTDVVLTSNKSIALIRTLTESSAFQILDGESLAMDAREENLELEISNETPAEIRYSSGSTGKPKGIVRSHRRLLNSARAMINAVHICPDDRLLALTNLSFGARDVLRGLLSGATIFPFDIRKQGVKNLAQLLSDEKITLYHSVPSTFRQLLPQLGETNTLPSLRLLQLGGDLVSKRDVEAYKNHFSDQCILVHSFSSSETGNLCTLFIDKSTEIDTPLVPVGFPAEGKNIVILDDRGKPLGFDAIGEIAVRSHNLSLGYWRNPGLTGGKFRTDSRSGEKVYLTGDLGKMCPDGRLFYLGRKDNQVKIRGIKVELTEIDAILLSHPGVAEVVTVVMRVSDLRECLVAYVVATPGTRPAVDELRRDLQTTLPSYMVPSRFVFLDSLPLTANGKVDRQGLPEPSDERPQFERVFVAPKDEQQRKLVQIWEGILGIRPIGIQDNFFDLGGHSLLAVELTAAMERAFGKNLTPATLFQAPTIEELGKVLCRESKSRLSLVPIQFHGTKPPFFWIHGDSSNGFLPRYLDPDQPLYGLEHQSQDGGPARYTSVESIAEHYLNEIRSVQAEGPYCLGGYSFGGIVALEVGHQLKAQQELVRLLFLLDPPEPLGVAAISPSLSNRASQSPHSLREFVRRHYVNMFKLGFGEKVAYFWERAKAKIDYRKEKIIQALRKGLCRVCVIVGKKLPASVRSFYILDIYHRARLKYEMQPYPGRVVLLRGGDRLDEYLPNWRKYLVGEIEFYELSCGHLDLPMEPYVQSWAKILKTCLEASRREAK